MIEDSLLIIFLGDEGKRGLEEEKRGVLLCLGLI